jgi:hypothetical protein
MLHRFIAGGDDDISGFWFLNWWNCFDHFFFKPDPNDILALIQEHAEKLKR